MTAAAGAAGPELAEAGNPTLEAKEADGGCPLLLAPIQFGPPQDDTAELSTGKPSPLISAAEAKARAAELTTVAASLLLYSPMLLEQPAQVGAAAQGSGIRISAGEYVWVLP